jgi:hypothetical protein
MANNDAMRKDLDNEAFLNLRQTTGKIADGLKKRLQTHLSVLKPLFTPRKLLGTYVRNSLKEDVLGSDKAFAKLQQRYAAICEKPFELRKELIPPLPVISNQLACSSYQYNLPLGKDGEKVITITSPTRYILSYESECSINQLKGIVAGTESRRPEDMKQSLINHLCMGILLEQFPELKNLLQDLRYNVETHEIDDLGRLPVVILTVPLQTFLPSDEFITQVTQLSGIPAFQEIIDSDAMKNMEDPLKNTLKQYL